MANKIKPKRSYTANAVPTTSDLDTNELAINWADSKAFTKNAAGNIVSVALGGGGSGLTWSSVPASATATGSAGSIAYDGSYFYLASAQNTWVRAALSTWVPFSPTSITGLSLWLDASDSSSMYDSSSGGSVVSAGGSIGRWQDKSGNSRNFTATGSLRPTLTASGLNGKSVVSFGGGNQLTSSTNIINSASVTVCGVFQRTSGNYGGFITSCDDTDGSPALLIDATKLAVRSGSGVSNLFIASAAFTGPSVVAFVNNSSTPSLYVNGSLIGSGNYASPSSSTTTAIGTYRLSQANFLNGYIAEMVVYNSALSSSDRSAVESYLKAKWGIA